MQNDQIFHTRIRSRRLPDYDYSQPGIYFLTITTHQNTCIFGQVLNGRMYLNKYGEIAEEEWVKSEQIRKEITLDAFVIMPNHVHGIVVLNDIYHVSCNTRNDQGDPASVKGAYYRVSKSISSFIAGYKSTVCRNIRRISGDDHMKVWQSNYYDHIVRDSKDLEVKRNYIKENPGRWEGKT